MLWLLHSRIDQLLMGFEEVFRQLTAILLTLSQHECLG